MSAPYRGPERRGTRLGIGTVLALVAAAAGLTALYARTARNLGGFSSDRQPDVAVVTTLVVALAGATVGLLRHASVMRTALALGATCAVLVSFAENEGGRIAIFVLPGMVALTVVLPLAILRTLGPDAISDPRMARRAAVAAGLLDVFLILATFVGFNFLNEHLVEGSYVVRNPDDSDSRSAWPMWWPWKPPKPMPLGSEPPDTAPSKIDQAKVPRADTDLLKQHFSAGKPLFESVPKPGPDDVKPTPPEPESR